jgi:ABC-type branched-subunit amino acid transport system substrate-binding protein
MKTKPRLFTSAIIVTLLSVITILGYELYICRNSDHAANLSTQNNDIPQKEKVARVGIILPMTGPTAYLGEGEALGSRLALESQNAQSPIKVEYVFEDSQGKPDIAISAVRKLLDVQNIRLHVVYNQ